MLFLPFALYQLNHFNIANLSVNLWALVVLSASLSCMFYYFWQKGLEHVTASTAAIFTSLMPIGTVVSAIFILHEHFGLTTFAGMLAVLISIVIGAEVLVLKRPDRRLNV